MAKRAIVLEVSGGRVQVCLWATVPAARQPFYANPSFNSAYKGATQQEIDALRAGAVVERTFPVAKDGLTNPQMQAWVEQMWQQFQDEVDSHNPWVRYGSSWDGATWTVEQVQ